MVLVHTVVALHIITTKDADLGTKIGNIIFGKIADILRREWRHATLGTVSGSTVEGSSGGRKAGIAGGGGVGRRASRLP